MRNDDDDDDDVARDRASGDDRPFVVVRSFVRAFVARALRPRRGVSRARARQKFKVVKSRGDAAALADARGERAR